MQACDECGVDLRYPTAAHIIDCPTPFEKRHGRPKPPPIWSEDYDDYAEAHGVGQVYRRGEVWLTGAWVAELPGKAQGFPTHAEAIAWAMKETG